MTCGQRFRPYKLPVAAIAESGSQSQPNQDRHQDQPSSNENSTNKGEWIHFIVFNSSQFQSLTKRLALTQSQGFKASDLEKFNNLEEDSQVQPCGTEAMKSRSMVNSNDENIIADDELEKCVRMATRCEELPEIEIGLERSSLAASNHSDEKTIITKPIQTHMGGFKLMMFNRLATQAHLDEEHLALGRQMCNIDNADQFVACVISTLAVRQEVVSLRHDISHQLGEIRTASVNNSNNDVWKANEELKAYLRSVATQSIMDGDLQGYTATEEKSSNGVKHKLAFSLYAKVLSAVLANPDQWKRRCLPPGYGTDPDPRSTKALQTAINNVLKEIRKEFDGVRMQAIHWGLNIGVYKKQTLWNVVDRKLEFLRGQTLQYRYAFYIVATVMKELDETYGESTGADEASHEQTLASCD
ncbi:hypothetical protein DFH28DRAFT_1129476 [Melampsora americana]|nr:hypothetical protein DFH28DRAFT_1129476 [Melampsora americana]